MTKMATKTAALLSFPLTLTVTVTATVTVTKTAAVLLSSLTLTATVTKTAAPLLSLLTMTVTKTAAPLLSPLTLTATVPKKAAVLLSSLTLAALLLSPMILTTGTARAQGPTGRLAPTSGEVTLQVLDKVTARTNTLRVPLGRDIRFGTLSVRVETCWRSLPLEVPESVAWLKVDEHPPGFGSDLSRRRTTSEGVSVFRGWLYASSPSVSSVEHPVYDIVLLSCGEE